MQTDDMTLLRKFAASHSEEAFATLVLRHVDMVYSVALRQVGDTHLAEDIAQAVFILLARKAGSLNAATILPGWLYRTARYVSANALTVQRRRQRREHEAYVQSIGNDLEPNEWSQIAPLLEGAMGELGGKDHDAVVMRFFKGLNFKEVGAAMGASENAAKMRVSRALEKMRKFLAKRGVLSTTALLAAAISTNSVQAAPTALAKSATKLAMTKGLAASGSISTLVNGALKIMAWTKAKTALGIGLGVLTIAGAATGIVKQMQAAEARTAWAGTTKMDFTGTDGAVFTGYMVRDGKTTVVSNTVPWSFTAPHVSSFEFHKVKRADTVSISLHYTADSMGAMSGVNLDTNWLWMKGEVYNGFKTQSFPN